MTRFIIAISILLFTALCVLSVSGADGQTGQKPSDSTNQYKAAPDTIAVEMTLDDGPYVYWQDDSTAIVFYFCDSAVDKRTFTVKDNLRFDGFCRDSAISYVISVGNHIIEPHIIDNASKIFAVSDIHGEYEYFEDILRKGGLIDLENNWIWGDGHLVIDGDVFDRGDKVTECLWLIYKLERQAKTAGGRVHFILGNHELMVLRGDNRYIHERYLDGIARKTRIRHEDLYGLDMELGRWLRSKHTAIKINNILFVHGGVGPFLPGDGWSLEELNQKVRESLDLRSSQVALGDTAKFLFGSKGPFWYRGYHYEMDGKYAQACSAGIDSVLTYYDVEAVVVGHTGVDSVIGLYDNRVFAIDIPFEDMHCLEALLWEKGTFYRVTGTGELRKFSK